MSNGSLVVICGINKVEEIEALKSSKVQIPVSSSVSCQIHNSLGKTAVILAYPS
jgi:hypothetical protein